MSRRTIRRTIAIVVAVVAPATAVTACGGEGSDVSIDSESGEKQIDTEDGSVSIGSTELPENWPAEIPLPDDYTLSFAMENATAEGSASNNPETADETTFNCTVVPVHGRPRFRLNQA